MSEARDARRQQKMDALVRSSGRKPAVQLAVFAVPYMAILAFLAVMGQDNPGFSIAMLAYAIFGGLGVFRRFVAYQDAWRRLAAPEAEAPAAPPALESVPSSVADLPELLERAEAWLGSQGQGEVAGRLRAGWTEVLRLARAEEAARALGGDDAELRAEVERLSAQAEAAKSPEARQMWTDNAATAAKRLDKHAELAASVDTTRARIEGYRQLLKSMAVDLTRIGLSDAGELAARGQEVARQVDLLVRTRVEVGESPPPEPPKPLAARAQRQGAG